MADQKMKFERTVLNGTNKVGKLKADADGYYRVNLGAFEAYNAHGTFYTFNNYLKNMFSQGSLLQQRISAGRLRGEVEHPQMTPGQNMAQYFNRLRMIDGRNTICHFKDVTATAAKDHEGRDIILVEASVRPSGVKRDVLLDQLSNKEENVCFSVRTICGERPVNGRLVREVRELITWDNVNDGGILIANKYDSAGLESAYSFEVTPELLNMAEQAVLIDGAGLESNPLVTTTMIRDDLGWSKTQLIKPSSMDW